MQKKSTALNAFNKENVHAANQFRSIKHRARRFSVKDIQNIVKGRKPKDKGVLEKPVSRPFTFKMVENKATADPQVAESFQDSILAHLKSRQYFYMVKSDYIREQKDLNSRMRAILVDWLVDVSIKFTLQPQTLFMTVNILDRYLSIRQVLRSELQLLGIAALMIASKYEEIYPPALNDYVRVCDNAYPRDAIIATEEQILVALQFNLTQPSSYHLLQLVQQKIKLDPNQLAFAQYILETALLDLETLKFNTIEQVAGTVFLVNKIFNRGEWNHKHTLVLGVNEKEAKACAKELHAAIQKIELTSLNAVKRKFSRPEYFGVSNFRIEKVTGVKN